MQRSDHPHANAYQPQRLPRHTCVGKRHYVLDRLRLVTFPLSLRPSASALQPLSPIRRAYRAVRYAKHAQGQHASSRMSIDAADSA
eukprot:6183998-Pleurochrysis_carterae.AAC.6